ESARLTDQELNARAAELFEVNFPDYKRYGFDDIADTRGDGTIELTSSGSVPTTIASLLHVDEIDVGSRSTAIWGSGRIELALVLDNTDSMDRQWKMQTLKEATHDLLNTLEESVYEEDAVKVSI